MTVRVGDPELVLDPYDYDFHEDPYPYYRRLRDEAPLYRNEERNFWAVSRHHDVLQGFRDSTALSNAYGVSLDPSSRTSEAYRVMSMLAMDDPAHLRMRTLVSKGFTPRRIRELEPQVLELARIHLDSALQTESFDFVAEFAGKLPMDVISELIGVPDTDRARIRALADAVLHREDGVADVPPPAMAACSPGPDGSPGGPGRAAASDPQLRSRRRQRRARPFQQRARICPSADQRAGQVMPRFEPHPARRTTVVAGASSGIGAATATELAGRGFPVALGARRMDKLAELVDKIRADGGEAVAFPLDVTDPESVKSFVAQTVEALGEVELLVSSAGDMLPGQLHEVSTEAFAEQVQIHLVGANRLATAVLPAMVARRRGDLIFVGSDVGLRQRPHMGAYGAAKAGLAAMVTNLQMELEGTGVRASIVHPGPTLTGMGWQLSAEQVGPMLADWAKWGQARHNYFLRPSDLARAIAFVAETPRGCVVVNMEIQPEAPLRDAPAHRQKLVLGEEGMPG